MFSLNKTNMEEVHRVPLPASTDSGMAGRGTLFCLGTCFVLCGFINILECNILDVYQQNALDHSRFLLGR